MIQLDRITVSLPGNKDHSGLILHEISLRIQPGEWVAVTGPNGSGKTTLLKTLAGLVPVSSGSIYCQTSRERPGAAGSEPIFALLLQDPDNQFVASSVMNELRLSARANGGICASAKRGKAGAAKLGSDFERRIREAVGRFSLGNYLGRDPHRLSGGEKQKLAMATVWLSDPDVLLLDEPLSFLDGPSRADCIDFVGALNRNGVTVLWASPGGDEILHAGSVAHLEKGRLKFFGTCDEFLSLLAKKEFELSLPALFMLGKKFVEIIKSDGQPAALEDARKGTACPARSASPDVQSIELPLASPLKKELVSFEKVSFAYEESGNVLQDVSFDIFEGECLGISGLNGSGKTTLLELSGGVLKPSSGRVSIKITDGEKKEKGSGAVEPRGAFYLLQSPERMFFAETVYEEMAFGLKNLGIRRSDIFSHIAPALARVGLDLELLSERSPFRLSFGEMRRLAFAIALSLQPRLLLLDEPTSCLDRQGEEALNEALGAWKEERAVVIASHDVDFLAEVCDRIIFLEDGGIGGVLELGNGELAAGHSWPVLERPYVLELQEAMACLGNDFTPRVLSVDRLVRAILAHAEADVS